jgi:superkiller protein 3
VATWANLGLLYLHHQDLELANQAFLRAQVLDPNYPLAWLGQGLVASAHGHELDAEHIFEHIVGLETTIVGLPGVPNLQDISHCSLG